MNETRLDDRVKALARFARELVSWALETGASDELVKELFEAGNSDID